MPYNLFHGGFSPISIAYSEFRCDTQENAMDQQLKNFISVRLDDQTLAQIRTKPRRFRSAWLRRIIADAVEKEAA